MRKRILSLVLAAVMAFSLAACGGNESEKQSASTNKNNEAAKQGVFKYEDIVLDLDADAQRLNVNQMKMVDGLLYMVLGVSLENGYQNRYVTMDTAGTVKSDYVIYEQDYGAYTEEAAEEESEYDEYHNIYSYTILRDGKLAYIDMTERSYRETVEYETSIELVVCNAAGEEVLRTPVTLTEEEGGYSWVNCVVESKEGTIFLMSYEAIAEVDMDGNILFVNKTDEVTQNLYSPEFYKDGMPVFQVWNDDYTEYSYVLFDLRTGQQAEELVLPDNVQNYGIMDGAGSGYDLVLSGSNAIYGVNVGDSEPTLIMDYVNSDLATYRVGSVVFTGEDTFIGLYNDIVEYDTHIAAFTHVAPDDVPDKEVLTLATYYRNTDLSKKVVEFNKASETLRITVKDYSEYSTQDDYSAGITKLNNEIISGNIPDIIACSSRLSIANYANKGFLADFYELIEKDETIKLEDYCENVFEAYAIDGKLYELPTSFYVQTVYGKTGIFGEETSLSWDKLNSILAQYPDAKPFGEWTKDDVLSTALRYSYNEFVDEVTGACSFDSDNFKSLLEFVNTFPDEIDYDALYADDDYWLTMQTQYMDDRTLLTSSTIYSVYEGWYNAYSSFLESVTPVGFPTDDGMGSTINAINSFAISAKSANVDGAWEFVRSFILPEAQLAEKEYEGDYVDNRYAYWGLPVLKEALYDAAAVAQEEAYYIEDGEKYPLEDSAWINNESIPLGKPSDEEVWRIVDFILSVNKKASDDYEKALEIISEEAAGYFSGAKSVDDVAAVIQSRMSILVSEDQ